MSRSKKAKAQPPPFVDEAAEASEKRTETEDAQVRREEAESADRRAEMDRVHALAR